MLTTLLARMNAQKQESADLSSLAASMLEQPYHSLMKQIDYDVAMEEKQKIADAYVFSLCLFTAFCLDETDLPSPDPRLSSFRA